MNEPTQHVTINFFIFGGQDEDQEEKNTDGSLMRAWVSLTDRERQVALKACQNLTNKQIAHQHYVSTETVKSQMRSILAKFGLQSKSDLRFTLLNSGLADMVQDV